MRILAPTLVASLALVTATGCGGDPAPVRLAHTSIARHRARAVARMLTIRASDLPELKATARAAAREGFEAGRYAGCAAPAARPWASARSDMVTAGGGYHALAASSNVSIMPSSAAARMEVARARSLDRTCMEHAIRARLAGERLRGVVMEPLSVNVDGADASVAYQSVVAYEDAPLVGYVDSIVFSYGQDVLLLSTYHSSKPVPPAMNERLLGLLVARARSHSR